MLYPLALVHAKIVIWALLPEVTAYGCFWPTCETTLGSLCMNGIPTLSQLKIWPGLWVKPFAFKVSSSRLKYLPMTSGLLALALVYDRGSAWRSILSGCFLLKESHHPVVTSTWGSRVLAISWAIARTSLRDLAYPIDTHPTKNAMILASSQGDSIQNVGCDQGLNVSDWPLSQYEYTFAFCDIQLAIRNYMTLVWSNYFRTFVFAGLTSDIRSLSRSSIVYNVVFLCSTHGPRMGRNERLTAEISIPILHVVRKWIPDPTLDPSNYNEIPTLWPWGPTWVWY